MKYDYLIVGAGLFGAVFAHEARKAGRSVLVVEKKDVPGGNIYTEEIEGINVHKYGTHIFHTDDRKIWDYVNRFAEFRQFKNAPVANFHGDMYSLPFNMYTFNKVWGTSTPVEAEARLREQIKMAGINEPGNLREKAISMVGLDIYERLVKGYTEKKWGKPCEELPISLISGFPVRMTYDNNYYTSEYQGIPEGGYTRMIEKMLEGVDVKLGVDYLENREELDRQALKTVYTGPLDAFFNYRLGWLGYRTVRMETETLDMENYQGNAIVNYTDSETPWTRIIEHKFFENIKCYRTVISREFFEDMEGFSLAGTDSGSMKGESFECRPPVLKAGAEPAYPMYDDANKELADAYRKLAAQEEDVIFAGRLGTYSYFEMADTVEAAIELSSRLIYRFR